MSVVECLAALAPQLVFYLLMDCCRIVLDKEQQLEFISVVKYFNENLSSLARDLAFLLGFYVKVIGGMVRNVKQCVKVIIL